MRSGSRLSENNLTTLDATPDEIRDARGPADAARKNLAAVLGIGARTIHNYRQRLGMFALPATADLEELLAFPFPSPESRVSPVLLQHWRETLGATRAVQFLLVHLLGSTHAEAGSLLKSLLKAWRRTPRPL